MPFWTYMLHCRGGAFYVGHTDDLERRVAQHHLGQVPGFTATRLPVELVWSQEFGSRDEAKAGEARIKGWSRAKKLALVRGDWGRISVLAKKKDGPSTSSGWTGKDDASDTNSVHAEPVEALHFSLRSHPDHPPLGITAVTARVISLDPRWLVLRWRVEGAGRLVVPQFAGRARVDGLWRETCFELFVTDGAGPGYAEFNFSPSERWAAYEFSGWREGMGERAVVRPPVLTPRGSRDVLIFDAALPVAALPPLPAAATLTAVLVEEGGVTSYWAPAHPPGKADFHAEACRTIVLPAPLAP